MDHGLVNRRLVFAKSKNRYMTWGHRTERGSAGSTSIVTTGD